MWKAYHIKKHSVIAVLFFLLSFSKNGITQSQYNLVPNYSFESYIVCPSYGSLSEVKANKPEFWYKPDLKFAAYYHLCAGIVPYHMTTSGPGFQYARTGDAYIGMFYYNGSDKRNFFQVKLKDSLRMGKCYYAECYINLSNSFKIACNNQSILFTKDAVYADTANAQEYILANPQVTSYNNTIITDTLNWIKVSGVFVAAGGEQYLTLGNFRNNAQTNSLLVNPSGGYNGAVYYVDDVFVIPLDSFPLPADAGPDRTIQQGQATYIGSDTKGLSNVNWYNSSGVLINSGVPGFNVAPASNTFYVIEQTVCGNYSRDTVYVYVQPLPLNFIAFTAAPVYSGDNATVRCYWQTASEVNVSHYSIERSEDGVSFYNIGKVAAKNTLSNDYHFIDPYPVNGLGYYRITGTDKDGKKQYSLVQQVKMEVKDKGLRLSPNPARDVITVSFKRIDRVTITDVAGRIILQQNGNAQQLLQLNIAHLSRGVYWVKVFSENNTAATQRLIVE